MVEINDGKCSASYPVIGNLENLKYNEWQAVAIAESLERSLKKKGDIEQYNAEVDDFLNRGVLVEVTRSEIAKWQESGGTACFITHHCVDRPDKATTKKRLVSNSSLKNYGRGPSPNEMWPKGPNALKSMIGIFLRFRIFPVALHFDITKMFHTVITGDPEKFMRLIVWRHGVKEASWKIYGFAKVSFGR